MDPKPRREPVRDIFDLSGKNNTPRFLRKMRVNLGSDFRIGHFIGCFHPHMAGAGGLMLQAFTKLSFGFAWSENQQRRSLFDQGNDLVIVSVELMGKLPVQHIIRLGSLKGMAMR